MDEELYWRRKDMRALIEETLSGGFYNRYQSERRRVLNVFERNIIVLAMLN